MEKCFIVTIWSYIIIVIGDVHSDHVLSTSTDNHPKDQCLGYIAKWIKNQFSLFVSFFLKDAVGVGTSDEPSKVK